MATLWFLFVGLCVATAAPADGDVKQGVAVVEVEDVPVLPAFVPTAEGDEDTLRQVEEGLRQDQGVIMQFEGLKQDEMEAGPSEEVVDAVGEPLVNLTEEVQDPQSENTEVQAVFCPDGWLAHGSRCFTVINSGMDWNSAEDHCRGKGASLASIHSPDENRFLQQLMKLGGHGDVWIGAYYVQTRWRWIDGSGLYFNKWSSPASSISQPCTCLNSNSFWVKASCSTNMKFICAATPGGC